MIARLWARTVSNPSAMIVTSAAAQSALRLVSNVLLARLLAPGVFALAAIATLVYTSIHMVSDVGIAVTALREGDLSRDDEHRLWTMQAIRGVAIGIVVAIAGLPVAWIYGNGQLRDALIALGLATVIDAGKSLYPVLALAHRRLLPSTAVELGGRVVQIAVSLLCALASPTIWALMAGFVASAVFTTALSHLLSGRGPRFLFDIGYIGRQWRFSRWIQASSTLTFAGGQIDKAVLPFLFGLPLLGIYGIAASFATMPSQVTQRWSGSVFYPLAVQMLRGEPAARARLMAVRTTMLLYTAIGTLAVMAAAPPFFLLLYAPRYHEAAALAALLGTGTYFEVGESSLRHFPLVEGTPHFEVWAVIVRLAAFAVLVSVAYALDAGIAGYALSYVGGLAASQLFILAVCVRRGYLRPGFDLLMVAALCIGGTLVYFLPSARGSAAGLIAEGAAVAAAAAAAMLVVYVRRGLPSLPAEPAPETLREVARDDLMTRPDEP